MDPEKRRKIEETVVNILKEGKMDEMKGIDVRVMAGEKLGMDFSDAEFTKVVRSAIDRFLISIKPEDFEGKRPEPSSLNGDIETVKDVQETRLKNEVNGDGVRVSFKLSNKRNVMIQDFKGKTWVSIREYYKKDGIELPSPKGIHLTTEQWSAFKRSIPAIEEAIIQMTSRLRSKSNGEQDFSRSKHDALQLEDVSRSQPNDEDVPRSSTSFTPQEFVEVPRFDGKNYHFWAKQMDLFLHQLKIAYVLTDPFPSATLDPQAGPKEIDEAKIAEQKWRNDDYMCRHNTLRSLSDPLFHLYSKKTGTARELWEELKLVYLDEEFGTKRLQVKRYIEFEMIEEKPIIEQVLELNNIADVIVDAGMLVDPKFHVSVILSKLPLSWKDVYIKLMREENLPFQMLMDCLRAEEKLRNQDKTEVSFNPVWKSVLSLSETNEMKNREGEMYGKGVTCFACGKKGHMARNCSK